MQNNYKFMFMKEQPHVPVFLKINEE